MEVILAKMILFALRIITIENNEFADFHETKHFYKLSLAPQLNCSYHLIRKNEPAKITVDILVKVVYYKCKRYCEID